MKIQKNRKKSLVVLFLISIPNTSNMNLEIQHQSVSLIEFDYSVEFD